MPPGAAVTLRPLICVQLYVLLFVVVAREAETCGAACLVITNVAPGVEGVKGFEIA